MGMRHAQCVLVFISHQALITSPFWFTVMQLLCRVLRRSQADEHRASAPSCLSQSPPVILWRMWRSLSDSCHFNASSVFVRHMLTRVSCFWILVEAFVYQDWRHYSVAANVHAYTMNIGKRGGLLSGHTCLPLQDHTSPCILWNALTYPIPENSIVVKSRLDSAESIQWNSIGMKIASITIIPKSSSRFFKCFAMLKRYAAGGSAHDFESRGVIQS